MRQEIAARLELADPLKEMPGLTEFEFDGLSARFGFADGHAYQDLDAGQLAIINNLPMLWRDASRERQRDVERRFAYAFFHLAGQISMLDRDEFRICTSASQSIDMACAWAARHGKRVALVEPTFDNLALIVKRWRVPLRAVPEAVLKGDLAALDPDAFDALFIVNPNNPTGQSLSLPEFTAIVEWCKARSKTLICDFCFRFFVRPPGDFYRVLIDSGVDFICIEDTGKTWATMDLKASVLAYSARLKAEVEGIFHEIFLGVSPFALSLLAELIADTDTRGLESTLWRPVAENRRVFRDAIAGSCLGVDPVAEQSPLALEWLSIQNPRYDDLAITAWLREAGIACLPGRFFHWSLDGRGGHRHVRFSLLKPRWTIEHGARRLRQALQSV